MMDVPLIKKTEKLRSVVRKTVKKQQITSQIYDNKQT